MNADWLLALAVLFLAVIVLLLWQRGEPDGSDDAAEEDARISPLLRGINYLLSDEPDRALQEMVQVARLRSETAEVYMALGEMFRSKGEIGRAVRIHQNILARPDATRDLHLQAHLALGKDFQAGGLLDRSLKHYRKALEIRPDHPEALEASLRIREQSREWIEAEALLSRIEQMRGAMLHPHRAYLFAQMAEDKLQEADVVGAKESAEQALKLHQGCAHAHLVLMALFLQQQAWDALEGQVRQMLVQAPEHLALSVPLLLQVGQDVAPRVHALLLECWESTRDEELALTWLEELGRRDAKDEVKTLREALSFHPSGLRAALRNISVLPEKGCIELAGQARLWRGQMKRFVCAECGVRVVDLRWQCPQCHTWGSMHAIHEDGLT